MHLSDAGGAGVHVGPERYQVTSTALQAPDLGPTAVPEIRRARPEPPVHGRRLTLRHLGAFVRFAGLRIGSRGKLHGGLFFLDRGARVEIGTSGGLEVAPGVRIMRDFTASFHAPVRFGRNLFVSRGVYMSALEGIHIGDDCLIGEHVSIHDMDHCFGPGFEGVALPARGFWSRPVRIGDNVWIGAKATIVSGVTIGDDVVVAANSVVTRDIPPHCLVGGAPARILRSWARPDEGR